MLGHYVLGTRSLGAGRRHISTTIVFFTVNTAIQFAEQSPWHLSLFPKSGDAIQFVDATKWAISLFPHTGTAEQFGDTTTWKVSLFPKSLTAIQSGVSHTQFNNLFFKGLTAEVFTPHSPARVTWFKGGEADIGFGASALHDIVYLLPSLTGIAFGIGAAYCSYGPYQHTASIGGSYAGQAGTSEGWSAAVGVAVDWTSGAPLSESWDEEAIAGEDWNSDTRRSGC